MAGKVGAGPASLAACTPFVMVAALIAIRNPTPLLRAEFWAEDALVFFADALNTGWRSLYEPVYGYHFLISRLIAWVATMGPIVAIPYVYSWGAFAVNAIAIGYFSRVTFRWIIPSDSLRIVVCLLMVLAPGGGEVMMNLCNLMTPLTLLVFLLLVETPGILSWGRFGAVVLLAASAGPVLMMSPLVAYLAWRSSNFRYVVLLGAMLPLFVANVVGNHIVGLQHGLLNYSTALLVPQALLDNFALRLFVLPIVGNSHASALMAASGVAYWSASLAGAMLLLLAWRRGRPPGPTGAGDAAMAFLLVGYACTVLTFAAIMVSRNYAILQILRQSGDPLWHVRYAYLPGAVALMIWTFVLYRISRIGGFNTVLGFGLLAIIAFHEAIQWENYPPRRDVDWPDAAVTIQHAVDARARGTLPHPVTVPVPVHPVYWRNGAIAVQVLPDTHSR